MRATTDKKMGLKGGGKKKEKPFATFPTCAHTYAHTYVYLYNTHIK